jgi:O-antigen ligase
MMRNLPSQPQEPSADLLDEQDAWADLSPVTAGVRRGRPRLGLTYFGTLLFSCVYFARPSDWLPLGSFPIAKLAGLIPVVLLAGAVFAGHRIRMNRELWLLVALFVQLVLCIPFSTWRGGSLDTVLFGFSKAVLLAVILVQVLDTTERIRRMIFVNTAAVAIVAAVSIYRGVSFDGRITGALNGIFGNPNDLAACIVVVLPFALFFMLLARNPIKKLLWLGVIILMVWAVVATYSRGGFISMVAAILAIAWYFGYKDGRKKLLGVLVLLVCLSPALLFSGGSYSMRVRSIFNFSLDQTGSADARQELLTTSLQITAKHPLFGIGPGQFAVFSGNWHAAHNSFTEMGAEAGIPAFVLFLLLQVHTFKRLRKSILPAAQRFRELRLLRLAALSSLIAFAVSACFASFEYELYPYILVAYCSAIAGLAEKTRRVDLPRQKTDVRFDEVAICAE